MTQASPARQAGSRSYRPGLPQPGGRYGLLLLVLIASYLLSAFSHNGLIDYLQVVLFLTALLLAFRTARVRRRDARLADAVALFGSAAAIVAALTGTQPPASARPTSGRAWSCSSPRSSSSGGCWPGLRSPCRASTAP